MYRPVKVINLLSKILLMNSRALILQVKIHPKEKNLKYKEIIRIIMITIDKYLLHNTKIILN